MLADVGNRFLLGNWCYVGLFSCSGVASVLHKALSRWVIGTPRTSVYSFRIQLPMPSRPSAVDRLRVFNFFNTVSVSQVDV